MTLAVFFAGVAVGILVTALRSLGGIDRLLQEGFGQIASGLSGMKQVPGDPRAYYE